MPRMNRCCGARAGSVHADVYVGCQTIKIPQCLGLDLFDVFFAEGGYRQRYVLHRFCTSPRGDNDLFNGSARVIRGCHLLGGDRCGDGDDACGTNHRRAKHPLEQAERLHIFSPR